MDNGDAVRAGEPSLVEKIVRVLGQFHCGLGWTVQAKVANTNPDAFALTQKKTKSSN